jgi:FAD-linked sulfhydryl oxidase
MKASGNTKSTTQPRVSEAITPAVAANRSNCPPDVEQLGNSAWTLLHTIAASYPDNPSTTQKEDLRGFMRTFSRLYPCWVCAEDFQAYIQKEQTKVGSRAEFGGWLCNAHNEVNRKLGKKEFDCSRWEERWRTGWKDGSCD